MKKILILLVFINLIISLSAQSPLIREDFDQLDNWEPLLFPNVDKLSEYRLVEENGLTLLEGKSEGSASGLLYTGIFDIYKTPVMEWRWKVDSILSKGNAHKKNGDDYPIRIYVLFEYDPDRAKGFQGIQYEVIKLFYGQYPPHSALNYVWANVPWDKEILPNAYTSQAVMFAKNRGSEKVGEWQTHRANLLEDYRRYFKEDPPRNASLAIMTDSDDTGESTHAYLDFITLGEE